MEAKAGFVDSTSRCSEVSDKRRVSEEVQGSPWAAWAGCMGRVQSACADSGEVGNQDGGKWACVQIVSPRVLVAV